MPSSPSSPSMALCKLRTPLQDLRGISVPLFCLSYFLIMTPFASPLSLSFPSFNKSTQGMVYQGVAVVDDTGIRLTKDQLNAVGKAVYSEPVRVWDPVSGNLTSFISRFSFIIDGFNDSSSGDGLTFFLSPYPSDVPFDSYGGTLGLFNGTADNITKNQILAVEFDSYFNQKYNDTSANHIGIDVNTVFSAASVDLNTSIKRGLKADAWVSYNAAYKVLSAFLSFAPNPGVKRNWTLSHVVDLRKAVPENVAVGFSAATGSAVESHSILSWDFSSTMEGGINPTAEEKKKSKRAALVIGPVVGTGILLCGSILLWFTWRHKKNAGRRKKEEEMAIDVSINNAFEHGAGPRRFLYTELLIGTNNFAEEGKLGSGGFGEVYKGVLGDNKLDVAIKRISRSSKQGRKEYVSEVTIISRLRHRNLVRLIGFCHEREELLLVYEFMPNGSLDTHLYSEKRLLSWTERYKIALGLASALLYLHEEWEQCIVHRDVKPSNVLLDSGLNAKLGDFGLARLVDHDRGLLTTVLAGTRGYIAPEYATKGKACKETDVYSFGVVALEIACGRRPVEPREELDKVHLVEFVWELYGRGTSLAAADGRLEKDFDEQGMERLMVVGLWCAHPDRSMRPTIRQAINVLNAEAPLPSLPPKMPVPVYCAPLAEGSNAASSSSGSLISNSAMQGR